MEFKIEKITIWPSNKSFGRREIEFQPDKINVITGKSSTGKSTITWILDYCLGSGSCSIPVGLIRKCVSWFGITFISGGNRYTLARRSPITKFQNEDYYFYFTNEKEQHVVDEPVANSSRELVKKYFDEFSGLPFLDMDFENKGIPYRDRPSYRDMAAFNFLPQHVIANPFTMYFKADSTEHREKLKTIFPLILGAIKPEDFLLAKELNDLEKQLEKLKRERQDGLNNIEQRKDELRGLFLKAQEIGVIPEQQFDNKDWGAIRYIRILSHGINQALNNETVGIREGNTERAVEALGELLTQEEALAGELSIQRSRLRRMERARESNSKLTGMVRNAIDRGNISTWMKERVEKYSECPLCKTKSTSLSASLKKLNTSLDYFNSFIAPDNQREPLFDKEISSIKLKTKEIEKALIGVQQQKKHLEAGSEEAIGSRYKLAEYFRFLGNIETFVKELEKYKDDGDLQNKIDEISSQIYSIRKKYDPRGIQEKTELALEKLNKNLKYFADGLELERRENNPSFNIKDLTIQFDADGAKKDYLWEIGSGQNWMGYHIAAFLSLHAFWVKHNIRFIPGFIVLDQFSQVYFPEAWENSNRAPLLAPGSKRNVNDDIESVKRVFSMLSIFHEKIKGKVQVIITEHAGELAWRGLENINMVGNWRDDADEFLIPAAWVVALKNQNNETKA